jgi:hypothetical protein
MHSKTRWTSSSHFSEYSVNLREHLVNFREHSVNFSEHSVNLRVHSVNFRELSVNFREHGETRRHLVELFQRGTSHYNTHLFSEMLAETRFWL